VSELLTELMLLLADSLEVGPRLAFRLWYLRRLQRHGLLSRLRRRPSRRHRQLAAALLEQRLLLGSLASPTPTLTA
jgi:hypothetical protein